MDVEFEIVNLPLRSELVCGPFHLVPRPPVEAEFGWAITATGAYEEPDGGAIDFERFARHGEMLDLLLSFAARCHVQIVNPKYAVQHGGEEPEDEPVPYLVWPGWPEADPWYHGSANLQAFLTHAYARVAADSTLWDEQGLQLALRLLDSARADGAYTQHYLVAWMGFEVLVNRSGVSGRRISRQMQTHLTKALKEALARLSVDASESSEDLGILEEISCSDVVSEIARRPMTQRATQFLTERLTFFEPWLPVVEENVLSRLNHMRARIVHGRYADNWKDADQFSFEDRLHDSYMRLIAGIELSVLSMIGWRPPHVKEIEASWTQWLDWKAEQE